MTNIFVFLVSCPSLAKQLVKMTNNRFPNNWLKSQLSLPNQDKQVISGAKQFTPSMYVTSFSSISYYRNSKYWPWLGSFKHVPNITSNGLFSGNQIETTEVEESILVWTLSTTNEEQKIRHAGCCSYHIFPLHKFCLVISLQEKDRDGCPKIVNLGTSKTDLFYERKKYGFKKR